MALVSVCNYMLESMLLKGAEILGQDQTCARIFRPSEASLACWGGCVGEPGGKLRGQGLHEVSGRAEGRLRELTVAASIPPPPSWSGL